MVEGIGDVVRRFYSEKLRELVLDSGKKVTFLWDSRYGVGDPAYVERMDRSRRELLGWSQNVAVLDRSDPKTDLTSIHPDVVFVCSPNSVHCDSAIGWLKSSNGTRPPPIISIEKPLDADMGKARDLLARIEPGYGRVFVADHYSPRATLTDIQERHFRKSMEVRRGRKWLQQFTVYFLENHSGNDKEYIKSNPESLPKRHGPIEVENRVVTLNDGLVLDLMPHALACLSRFGIPGTFRITYLKAGQYTGVDGVDGKATEIDFETFAEVRMTFRESFTFRLSDATIYLGKGVGGVRKFKSFDGGTKQIDGEAKFATIDGTRGERAIFDFKGVLDKRGKGRLYLRDRFGKEDVAELSPNQSVVTRVMNSATTDPMTPCGVTIEDSKRILETIDDVRHYIRGSVPLPKYALGPPGGEDPYLEEILERLPVLIPP